MTDKLLAISDRNYGVLENAGVENDGQNFSNLRPKLRGLENAGQLCGLHMSKKNRLM